MTHLKGFKNMCWPQQEWVDSPAVSLVNRLARVQQRGKLSPERNCHLQRKLVAAVMLSQKPVIFDCRDKVWKMGFYIKADWEIIPAELRVYIMRVIGTLYPGTEGSLEWSMQLMCKRNIHLHVDESKIGVKRKNTKGDTSLFNCPLCLVIYPFLLQLALPYHGGDMVVIS